MKIGETARHTFTLPFVLENPQDIRIRYHQKSGVVLEKGMADIVALETFDTYTVFAIDLTTEETTRFKNGETAIVLDIVTSTGETMVSDLFFCPVEGFPREVQAE